MQANQCACRLQVNAPSLAASPSLSFSNYATRLLLQPDMPDFEIEFQHDGHNVQVSITLTNGTVMGFSVPLASCSSLLQLETVIRVSFIMENIFNPTPHLLADLDFERDFDWDWFVEYVIRNAA